MGIEKTSRSNTSYAKENGLWIKILIVINIVSICYMIYSSKNMNKKLETLETKGYECNSE